MRGRNVWLAVTCVILTGCANKAQTGTVIGAAGGAAAGAAIGHAAGSTAKGVIIGAVVGGAAGAIIGVRMDRQAKELEQTVEGATVERVGEGIQVTFDSGLLFDFDSDVVRSEAKTNLRALGVSLSQYPDSDLLIVGHTDEVGSNAYNQTLSLERADAVASYLRSQGVSGARLATSGLGEMEPIASNATEVGRQTNRRVEVAIFASPEARASANREASNSASRESR